MEKLKTLGEKRSNFRIDIANGALRLPTGNIKYFPSKEVAEQYARECGFLDARVIAAKTQKQSEQPEGCHHKMRIEFTEELHTRLKRYQKTKPYFVSLSSIVCHALWLYLEDCEKKLRPPQEMI